MLKVLKWWAHVKKRNVQSTSSRQSMNKLARKNRLLHKIDFSYKPYDRIFSYFISQLWRGFLPYTIVQKCALWIQHKKRFGLGVLRPYFPHFYDGKYYSGKKLKDEKIGRGKLSQLNIALSASGKCTVHC